MDDDVDTLTPAQLIAEVKRLRAGIRAHRDSSGQELCWHHPKLWSLLPDGAAPRSMPLVPPWPDFLHGCVRYRRSLDEELASAARGSDEIDEIVASMLWRRLDVEGHDACVLVKLDDGWRLEGAALFDDVRLAYEVECDLAWVSRWARVDGTKATRRVAMFVERDRRWSMNGVASEIALEDIDLGFTPATNLFQLRRMALRVGERKNIDVAWFDVDGQSLVALPQRYERLTDTAYAYESPTVQYAAILDVDALGFVRDYPGLWSGRRSDA